MELDQPQGNTDAQRAAAALRLARARRARSQARHRERARELAATGDPARYFRRVFGWKLERSQKLLVQAWMDGKREIICVGANGTGKSAVIFGMCLGWAFDALGSQLADDGDPVGCALFLIAPTEPAGLEAYQKHFLGLGKLAESNGHLLPGWGKHSTKSVLWAPEPGRWYMRQILAPKEAGTDEVSHQALGAHHENIAAAIEEIRAVSGGLIEALRGRLRSSGNVAVASTNPTSATGLGYELSTRRNWTTVFSSAIDNEQVIARDESLFPGMVSHIAVEADLRQERDFEVRGDLWTGTGAPREGFVLPDPKQGDFCYALPPEGVEDEKGPREDGYSGHPRYPVLVMRPRTGVAYGRILGRWPEVDPMALFSDAMISAATGLWSAMEPPDGPPDAVGIDASESAAGNQMVAHPRWGPTPREILRQAWRRRPVLREDASGKPVMGSLRQGAEILRTEGLICYVGRGLVLEQVDTDGSASRCVSAFGTEPAYQIDIGYGLDIAASLRGKGATAVRSVNFGARPQDPLSCQRRFPENFRCQMYFDMADVMALGLMAIPEHTKLREDLRALGNPIELKRAAKRLGRRGKMTVYGLKPKRGRGDTVMRTLGGRSSDWGDSVACSSCIPRAGRVSGGIWDPGW